MLEIPGYKCIKELGQGGMAYVFLAIQKSIDRKVAIKVMSQSLAADPSFSERFLKEARMAHLTHPNIVTVYDAGKIENQSYIIMEYAAGGNLSQHIREGITVSKIISIIRQISGALNYAHSNGVVHRDIKSENILLRENGEALLVDFGIAKALTSNTQLTQINTTIGSPSYMSPEQARGLPLDGRSDLYSLGVVLFECLSGKKPYEAEDTFAIGIKHISDPVPELPPQLSIFQPIINCLLAKTPEERFSNGNELIGVLDNVFETLKKENSPILTMANKQFIQKTGEEKSHDSLQNVSMINNDVTKLRADDKTEMVISPSEYARHSSTSVDVEPSKSNMKLLVGIVFIIIISGGALWYNEKFQLISMSDSKTEKIALAAEQKGPEQVDSMLKQAAQHMEQRQYTTPKEANAYDLYQRVLGLDPENASAQKGLGNIVKAYETMAIFRLADFQYESALKMVNKGLAVNAEHQALQELKKGIELQMQSQRETTEKPQVEMAEKSAKVADKKQNVVKFYKSAIVQDHSLFETTGEHVSNTKINLKPLSRQDMLNNVYMKAMKHCNATVETMASNDCKTIYQRYYSNWPIPGLKATYSEKNKANFYQAKYILNKADTNAQLNILSDLAIDVLNKPEVISDHDALLIANYELAKPLLSLNGTELLADTSEHAINDSDTSRIPKVNSLEVLIPMVKDKLGASFATVSFLQKGSLEVTPFDFEILKLLRKNLLDPSLRNIGSSLHARYTKLPSNDIHVEFWSFNAEGYVQGRKHVLLDNKIGINLRKESVVPVEMLIPQKTYKKLYNNNNVIELALSDRTGFTDITVGSKEILQVKAHQAVNFYVAVHVIKAGDQYSYLLPLKDAANPFVESIAQKQSHQFVTLGEITVTLPLGVEVLHLIASNADLDKYLPENTWDESRKQFVINGTLGDVTNGIKAIREAISLLEEETIVNPNIHWNEKLLVSSILQ